MMKHAGVTLAQWYIILSYFKQIIYYWYGHLSRYLLWEILNDLIQIMYHTNRDVSTSFKFEIHTQ